MLIYWEVFKFRFLRFLAYPFEILAGIFRRVLGIAFLIYLWSLVLKNIPGGQSITEIASYFLIAQGVEELVNAKWSGLGKLLGGMIKNGTLSNYLIKPVSIIPFLNFSAMGANGLRLVLSLISLIIGISINPNKSLVGFLLFILFFIAAYAVAFAYNLFLGIMYFHMTEASGFKNSIEHMVRVLSGSWVPLSYFPTKYLTFVKVLPFQAMVFGPTNALFTNSLSQDVLQSLSISFFWAISLNILVRIWWNRSIKSYEAVGI